MQKSKRFRYIYSTFGHDLKMDSVKRFHKFIIVAVEPTSILKSCLLAIKSVKLISTVHPADTAVPNRIVRS